MMGLRSIITLIRYAYYSWAVREIKRTHPDAPLVSFRRDELRRQLDAAFKEKPLWKS